MTVFTAALAVLQTNDVTASQLHWLTIFVGFIAAALIVAAISMALIAGYAAKLLLTVDGIAKEVKEHTAPLLDRTHMLLTEIAPKVSTFTSNAEHISSTVRTQVDELAMTVTQLNATAQNLNARAQVHVAHVDGIVHDALNAAEDISNTVQQGIKAPLRQVVGVVAGVRAGLDKLFQLSPFGRG
jgi:methyl-accepting chemotaxis protein